MSAIFLTYRHADSANGVLELYAHLAQAFGAHNLVLDKKNFVGGAEWLPQIRASVASCDALICVIGESGLAPSKEQVELGIDYVEEELLLAKKLAKPIIPVTLAGSSLDAWARLPSSLQWLKSIHAFPFDSRHPESIELLVQAITGASGVKRLVSTHQTGHIAELRFSLWSTLRALLGSMLRPLGYASAALRPDLQTLAQSFIISALSLCAYVLTGALVWGTLTSFQIARFAASILAAGFIGYAIFYLCARIAATKVSSRSMLSYAFHSAGVLNAAIAVWFLVYWILLPEPIQEALLQVTASGDWRALQAIPNLSLVVYIGIYTIQGFAFVHLVYLLFGIAKAATVTLGSRMWLTLVPVGLLALATFSIVSTLFQAVETSRSDGLPRDVVMTWQYDAREVTGLIRSPFRFELRGRVSKQSDRIVLEVHSLEIENRDQPATTFPSISCSLGQIRSGQFVWPELPHRGKVQIDAISERNQKYRVAESKLEIPLGTVFRSSETTLNCFVDGPRGTSYPLSNGGLDVLSW